MKWLCLSIILVISTSFLSPVSYRVQPIGAGKGLFNRNWELKELRFLQDNELHYYKQDDHISSTINLDHDYYRFHTDGSGLYHQRNGKEFAVKWNFAKDDSSAIIFFIDQFSDQQPLRVTWEGIQLAGDTLRYQEYYTHHSGLKSFGNGLRVAARASQSGQHSVVSGRP